MISIDTLPKDDSGVQPAGMWLAVLRDNLTDGFAGCIFQEGVLTAPINGRALVRLVVGMPVIGAMRVEGEPFAIGDVSRLMPEAPAAPAPVPAAEPAKPVAPSAPASPTTKAELQAMPESELRALATRLGGEGAAWKLGRVRRFVADELGIEGA